MGRWFGGAVVRRRRNGTLVRNGVILMFRKLCDDGRIMDRWESYDGHGDPMLDDNGKPTAPGWGEVATLAEEGLTREAWIARMLADGWKESEG
jgi:hypothetical protein